MFVATIRAFRVLMKDFTFNNFVGRRHDAQYSQV